MRKFLFIFFCVLSFCAHSEVYQVYLDEDQLDEIFYSGYPTYILNILTNGSFDVNQELSSTFPSALSRVMYNQRTAIALLHLIMSGDLTGSYDVENNNILAYASSLRQHNDNVRQMLEGISDDVYGIWYATHGIPTHFLNQFNLISAFRSDFGSYTNNVLGDISKIYDAITNLNLNVSLTNDIFLAQYLENTMTNSTAATNLLADILNQLQYHETQQQGNFNAIIDLLRDFQQNGFSFPSNFCDCCCAGVNSNYQDGVLAMLDWMTNNFPDAAESPIYGGGGSNDVWWVWRPSDSGWRDILVPKVGWQENTDGFGYIPFYGDKRDQYDQNFLEISQQYGNLIQEYQTGGIDGQKFFTGLVDLQLHILANMSTQLYMLDNKMPSKTNLWDWIDEYKYTISDAVNNAESENSEIVNTATGLLDYSPFTIIGGHFPKVNNALNSLKLDKDTSPVIHIPIPRALRVSDSDELVVDVRESDWYADGRRWCNWIFTFIWGWLFIRLGLVPLFYIFFFTLRVAEIAAHLVFMGSVRGSSGICSSFGAGCVDLVLSLIGIDTDFKRWVFGIMRD